MSITLSTPIPADAAATPAKHTPLYKSLFVQVLVALLLGVSSAWPRPIRRQPQDSQRRVLEADLDDRGADRLLRGRARHCRSRRPQEGSGGWGMKALIYFEVMTTVALIVGLTLAFIVGPGTG